MSLCFILCRLIEQIETYSLSLGSEPVVKPNIAIQSGDISSEGSTGVLFTVQKGELFVSCACNSKEHSATNYE